MQVHPAIAALRRDDAPQRQAQAALFAAAAAWKESAADILADLARFGAGEDIDDCQMLAELFFDAAKATEFAGQFIGHTAQALRTAPLAHVPFRHFTDGTISTLLLARSGRASLFLAGADGAGLSALPPPRSVSFSANESREIILAGRARAELVSTDVSTEVSTGSAPLELVPGSTLGRDCRSHALILREVRGTLVSLRLQRRNAVPEPTREIDLATGALIHQAAASAQDSRRELMIALLARMERRDAAPLLAAIAGEGGVPAVRWQALRECLGLDTLAGFRILTAIARAEGDPLAAPAGALHAQLIEMHPEIALCPV